MTPTSQKKTKFLLITASILQEPLACLQSLLPILIIKQLNAGIIHISFLTSLLPTVAIISFYWGSLLHRTQSLYCIRHNLVSATLLAALLFLFTPWMNNPWFFVLAGSCYFLFFRAANPARIEIFKKFFKENTREALYSKIFKTIYGISIILAPVFGKTIDTNPKLWRILFFLSALLYMLSALCYQLIPIQGKKPTPTKPKQSALHTLIEPWLTSYAILKKNPLFSWFQLGFFITGFGLMLAKPATELLLGNLPISYYSLFIGRLLFKGIGVIGSAKVWSRHLNAASVLSLASLVAYGFMSYTLLVMATSSSSFFIFPAYLLYGITQSGSHLIWNLSGALLSGNESSCQYSSVNILSVGIRGSIAPAIGGLCIGTIGMIPALSCGTIFMLFGAYYLSKKHKDINTIQQVISA